jgi:hypothetical protein
LDFSNDTSAESQYANHKDNAQHDGAEWANASKVVL